MHNVTLVGLVVVIVAGVVSCQHSGGKEANSMKTVTVGEFEGNGDVGKVLHAGSVEFVPGKGQYRVTGSGENIWGAQDAFHHVWRKVSGDLVLAADIEWVGQGKNLHRKAGWMVRQGLSADSPYADVMVHGDGLISLQYRRLAGGPTMEVQSAVKGTARVQLERNGDLFRLSVVAKGGVLQPVGSVTVALGEAVYAGLAVSSHDAGALETAVFSNVVMKNGVLKAGQQRVRETSLEIVDVATGERKVVYRAVDHFEAPNWSLDGKTLIINRRGRIYTLPVGGGELKGLETGVLDKCNNDHGFSPDGKWLAVSHHDEKGRSLIYVVPSGGGTARQVTKVGPSYWHGWSPDGKTLAYCGERKGEFDVYTIEVEGGQEKRLTNGPGLDDGPDYTADGKWIYWNSERSGVMKIWRMKADGTGQEPVTTDAEYADWFPHPSPDGKWVVFLSYDKSVKGHPENQDVVLRVMSMAGGKAKVLATLFGGQGTLNVPSWSPDSRSIAFVSYRFVCP